MNKRTHKPLLGLQCGGEGWTHFPPDGDRSVHKTGDVIGEDVGRLQGLRANDEEPARQK